MMRAMLISLFLPVVLAALLPTHMGKTATLPDGTSLLTVIGADARKMIP
jgi:hypothetical protein